MTNPVIRRNLRIGAADAEADEDFLANCFIDTGDLETLLSSTDPRCIVLGRTGVGKTALLHTLSKRAGTCAELAPEALSLNYIANSNVLRFFEEAGVSLDIFYQLLWRHIFVVEALKLRYQISNPDRQREMFRQWTFLSHDRTRSRAIAYLQSWGDKFWEETEYRTREFAQKLENDLKASVTIDSTALNLGASGAKRLTTEERGEVRQRGMQIVNAVQIKELHDVIELLATEVFTNHAQQYYLIIDRLDEGWVDDRIRFKLLKALVQTLKSFHKVQGLKVVIALRTDLHQRMLQEAANPDFQEEKFKSLYQHVRWTRAQIVQLLEARVRFLFKHRYTGDDVSLADILPDKPIDHREPVDFIIDRSFMRPREAIIFMNECLEKAEGSCRISATVMRQAEQSYFRFDHFRNLAR